MRSFFLFLLASHLLYAANSDSTSLDSLAPFSPASEGAAIAKAPKRKRGKGKRGKGKHGKVKRGKGPKGMRRKPKGVTVKNAYLSFSPPLLKIGAGAKASQSVAVKLLRKPAGSVSVYLEAPNLIFSRCRLSFSEGNWNVPQNVVVSPVPYITNSKINRVISARFCCNSRNDESLHNKCQNYVVRRGKGKGRMCNIYGDPHYKGFSGRLFDFQGQGAYYLVKSDYLTVQQMNVPWNGATTVQSKVAIRCQDSVYIINGHGKTIQRAAGKGKGIQLVQSKGVHWRLTMPDGSSVKVGYTGAAANAAAKFHLSTNIILGQSYNNNLGGLCGNPNVKKFIASNGRAVGQPKAFGQSWKVSKEDNLFKLGGRAISVINSRRKQIELTKKNKCKIPDFKKFVKIKEPTKDREPKKEPKRRDDKYTKEPRRREDTYTKEPKRREEEYEEDKEEERREEEYEEDKEDGTDNCEKGEEYVTSVQEFTPDDEDEELIAQASNAKLEAPKKPTKFWLQTVKKKCTKMLTIKQLNKIVNPAKYIKGCVSDCVLSKSFDLMESSKRAYLSEVEEYVRSAEAEPVYRGKGRAAQSLKAAVAQAYDAAGFGHKGCPRDCSGNGKCVYNGCACNPGYTGVDCSEEIAKPPPEKKCYTNEPNKDELDITEDDRNLISDKVDEAYKEKEDTEEDEEDDEEEGENDEGEEGEYEEELDE